MVAIAHSFLVCTPEKPRCGAIPMPRASAPFDYPEEERAFAETPFEIRTDTLRRLGTFLNERVLARTRGGRLPSAATIAVRMFVLHALLNPEQRRESLMQLARELGCTRQCLSRVAIEFSDALGLRAPWQRLAARNKFAARAKGVHAGTWKSSDKWEARTRRESAKCKKPQALPAKSAARQKLPVG